MPEILRQYRMKFERVPEGEPAILNPREMLGLRSKLGGVPDWDQDAEVPVCPHCKEQMTFLAQIDSIEHMSEANPNECHPQEYMFGDVGMIYVFWCISCDEIKGVLQCG